MIAVGYFRESREAGLPGLAEQGRDFLDYCQGQGFEVATTFSEDARPGSSSGYAQLISYLKEPEKGFVVVVVNSPGALADGLVAATARCLQLERLGARVQFIHGQRSADALEAVMDTWTTAAQDERRDKVRSALRRKAVRGEVLGRPPYGYRVGPHNRLDLVDEEALVVRYIYNLYLHEGLGVRLIARRLNEEGLRTRRNKPWSMVSIRDMLRNRAYVGTYQRLGVRVPGTHAAIVSPEDFRRVQDRMEDRRTNYSPRKVTGFLLSGLAVCASCGNRMIGVSRRQAWKRRRDGSEQVASYRYYQCESRTNQGLCSYNTRRAADLEEIVLQRLANLDARQLAAPSEDAAVIGHWRAEAARVRERLHQVDRRLARALETSEGARVTAAQLRKQGMDLAGERLQLEDELRDAEWRSEHYASAAERRRTRAAALELLVSRWAGLPVNEKQALLRELIEEIRVGQEDVEMALRP